MSDTLTREEVASLYEKLFGVPFRFDPKDSCKLHTLLEGRRLTLHNMEGVWMAWSYESDKEKFLIHGDILTVAEAITTWRLLHLLEVSKGCNRKD